MTVSTLTIVGVGLIGGSIGLAAKQSGLARRVVGVGRHVESLERARGLGAIDDIGLDLAAASAQSQMVVFCTPVDLIAQQVLAAAPACSPGTLLTDAGSTKAAIVAAVEGRLRAGVDFVGSHPLAGSEKRGPEFADANLFQGRVTVVTPSARTLAAAVQKTQAFWQSLGSRVVVMRPEDHDRALAWTSHLPHLAASALAGILPEEWAELTATGFRDTTRIAAGDPSIWTGIFAQNREAVQAALGQYRERLGRFEEALAGGDAAAIAALLAEGKRRRDVLGS